MSVLGYSALNKIKKTLDTEFGEKDDVSIISKEVVIDYSDLASGNKREINIGPLPENCVLLHSSLEITIPFLTSSNETPVFNLGLENEEDTFMEYPSSRIYRFLIFNQYPLNVVDTVDHQGETSGSSDKLLNEYSNSLMAQFVMRGVWSSGGSLITARFLLGGCGTQPAGLSMGGYVSGGVATCEEYYGNTWSSGGSLNTARYGLAGCGTQTAGLCFGGVGGYAVTEEYDGGTWAAGGSMNTLREQLAGCGTQTAGLSFGGYYAPNSLADTEEYNGATWTASNDLNSARYTFSGCGTQTAGLSFGGWSGIIVDRTATTEEYDGTNWSIGNTLNSSLYGGAGCGNQTAALSFGGEGTATTEEYDGTSWFISNDLSTARHYLAAAGSQTSGLSFGGTTGSASAVTEEYDPENLSDLTQGSLSLYVTYTHR